MFLGRRFIGVLVRVFLMRKNNEPHIAMTHEEQRKNSLNKILDVAEAALLDVGVSNLNLNTIVKQGKIARGTFFKHVVNKETLIAYLAIRGLNKMLIFAELCSNRTNSIISVGYKINVSFFNTVLLYWHISF